MYIHIYDMTTQSGRTKCVHTYIYIYMCIYRCRAVVTGCRRVIGSPTLQIIFHKKANKYRSLLRKITYKDKGSYESSPPCSRNTLGLPTHTHTYTYTYTYT